VCTTGTSLWTNPNPLSLQVQDDFSGATAVALLVRTVGPSNGAGGAVAGEEQPFGGTVLEVANVGCTRAIAAVVHAPVPQAPARSQSLTMEAGAVSRLHLRHSNSLEDGDSDSGCASPVRFRQGSLQPGEASDVASDHVSSSPVMLAIRAARKTAEAMERPKLVAQPLSHDQTAFRADERERVTAFGARVLTVGELEKSNTLECQATSTPGSGVIVMGRTAVTVGKDGGVIGAVEVAAPAKETRAAPVEQSNSKAEQETGDGIGPSVARLSVSIGLGAAAIADALVESLTPRTPGGSFFDSFAGSASSGNESDGDADTPAASSTPAKPTLSKAGLSVAAPAALAGVADEGAVTAMSLRMLHHLAVPDHAVRLPPQTFHKTHHGYGHLMGTTPAQLSPARWETLRPRSWAWWQLRKWRLSLLAETCASLFWAGS
jgi:hypothetical protein